MYPCLGFKRVWIDKFHWKKKRFGKKRFGKKRFGKKRFGKKKFGKKCKNFTPVDKISKP